ncbi:MAG: bifunctional glutamate N-acetyltransferase/amino-acid acetyltransferase ArgJ, partial [Alphaproteobacteria bacterium]
MKKKVDEKGVRVPGFRFGAAACGIKKSGVADLGVIVADQPAVAAAAFTKNSFRAAPVEVASEKIRAGRLQALVVNSGNANACTGRAGLAAARRSCAIAAGFLDLDERLVAPASTGVIGVPLPLDAVEAGVEVAADSLEVDGMGRFARAIMTSDAYPKIAHASVTIGRRRVSIAAIAKGAGMICPDMATLLVFFLTDAVVGVREARRLVRRICSTSLNSLSVDGDTSTNDSLFLLASGEAGNDAPAADSPAMGLLEDAVDEVGWEIARLVAADGEGSTKLVTIEVRGAAGDGEAHRVARTVGNSSLVKTAFFGSDPNWGRIACAIGYSGVRVDPAKVTIRIGDAVVFRRGEGVPAGRAGARVAMKRPEFDVRIDLGDGAGRARYVTGDLSTEYVKFNSA